MCSVELRNQSDRWGCELKPVFMGLDLVPGLGSLNADFRKQCPAQAAAGGEAEAPGPHRTEAGGEYLTTGPGLALVWGPSSPPEGEQRLPAGRSRHQLKAKPGPVGRYSPPAIVQWGPGASASPPAGAWARHRYRKTASRRPRSRTAFPLTSPAQPTGKGCITFN
jgi:hypothetical protein